MERWGPLKAIEKEKRNKKQTVDNIFPLGCSVMVKTR